MTLHSVKGSEAVARPQNGTPGGCGRGERAAQGQGLVPHVSTYVGSRGGRMEQREGASGWLEAWGQRWA